MMGAQNLPLTTCWGRSAASKKKLALSTSKKFVVTGPIPKDGGMAEQEFRFKCISNSPCFAIQKSRNPM